MITKTHLALPSKDIYRRIEPSIWNLSLVSGILCLVGVFVLLWYSFARMNMAYALYGPSAVPGWGQATLVLAAILFVLAMLILIAFAIRRKYGLVISKEGLTFYRPFFAEVFIPWVDVQGIAFAQDQFIMVSSRRENRAVVWLNDARHVSLNKYVNSNDLPNLVTRIKAELYPQLEIRLRNALLAGQEVSFGPLGLSANGIKWLNQYYSWNYIDQITVEKGLLEVVLSNRKIARFNIIRIPNLEILILLVREFEKG